MRLLNVYGPPGTGKTTRMVRLFVKCAEQFGADRVGYVSYTKAAANEAKDRVATAFGVRFSDRQLPYVGTIHSLCFHLLGLRQNDMVDGRGGHWRDFCDEMKVAGRRDDHYFSTTLESGAFWWNDLGVTEEADLFRRCLATSKHRQIPMEEAALDLPADKQWMTNRLLYLADKYEAWKQREELLDFEDLLVEGAKRSPTVLALLVDEVQDNSKLMWSVIDAWSRKVEIVACAGDAFQSIYRFVGADPRLFTERDGEWIKLPVSQRLTPDAAAYANRILTTGGWDDDRFVGTWEGKGAGEETDGSTAYLARTQRLLLPIRENLEETGEPYLNMRGSKGAFQTKAADAYRMLARLQRGDVATIGQVLDAAKQMQPAALRKGAIAELGKMDQAGVVDAQGAEHWLGDLHSSQRRLKSYDYMKAVEMRHGFEGLFRRPKIELGTIHASKGREWDHVKLVRSWGVIPSRSITESLEGRRSETCVAYVSASRHRVSLTMLDADMGVPYPFPGRVR